ncbi:MAG: NAD(P)-dependent oxidoreductase [Anaerolineales bacterium]
MKLLLTGASGFIGSHVARRLLAKGHRVMAVAVPNDPLNRISDIADRLEICTADLSDTAILQQFLEAGRPDACIHLAWYSEPGQYLHSPENISALNYSLLLVKALAEVGCQNIVAAGTCAEYDLANGKVRETSPIRPDTLYAASKLSLLFLGGQISKPANMKFAWGRIFYLYGPDEDPRRLVPAMIRALLAGKSFPTTAGDQVRDYLHVEDVADAFVTLAEKRADGIYNICSSEPITIRQLVETGGRILDRPELLQIGALPYRDWEPMYVCGDNQRLKGLGWKPAYDLSRGMESACRWWKQQK